MSRRYVIELKDDTAADIFSRLLDDVTDLKNVDKVSEWHFIKTSPYPTVQCIVTDRPAID